MARVRSKRRRSLLAWLRGKALGFAFRVLFGGFLLVHAYALALRWLPAPVTALMIQKTLSGEEVRQDYTPLRKISPHLVRAVIAAEDAQFCMHDGVDVAATRVAFKEWRAGERLRGASTISQQTAKNVFLWNGGGFARKLPEAWLAVFIDYVWGKRRVMEMYLNVAEWGDGLFGAEAAAQARFGKSVQALTRREAALLAAVLPSPNKWRVDPPGPYVRRRSATLQARMQVVAREGLSHCVLLAGT